MDLPDRFIYISTLGHCIHILFEALKSCQACKIPMVSDVKNQKQTDN